MGTYFVVKCFHFLWETKYSSKTTQRFYQQKKKRSLDKIAYTNKKKTEFIKTWHL